MTKAIKARPTIYNGIEMRSRLEAGFAAWLDKHQFNWKYEPHALATEDGQYLPDFVLGNVFLSWLPNPTKVYVEVKPDSPGKSAYGAPWQVLQQHMIVRQADPNAVMILARPSGLTQIVRVETPEDRRVRQAELQAKFLEDPSLKAKLDAAMASLGVTEEDLRPDDDHLTDWEAAAPITPIRLHDGRVGFSRGFVEQPWQGKYWKAGR